MWEYSCGVRGGGAEPGRMSVGLEAAGSMRGVAGGNRIVRNDAAAPMAAPRSRLGSSETHKQSETVRVIAN